MEYVYRSGFSVPGVAADVVATELDRIRADGDLTPERVVTEAEREESPLHPAFTWDDSEAAGKWRLNEARHLLRGIEVVYEDREPLPMHFHVSTDNRPRYERFDDVGRDEDLRDAAMAELQGHLKGSQRAVDQLIEVCQLRGKRKRAANTVKKHLEEASEALAGV